MTYFITTGAYSLISGLYTDEVGYATPPQDAIQVSDEVGEALRYGFSGKQYVGGVVSDSLAYLLALAQSEQTAIIEAAFQSANTAPIQYGGTTFQADADSVALMAQVATALPIGASITWYDSTNVGIALTDVQFAELRGSILMRGQPLFTKKQTLKAAIRAATTVAQVEAVVW